MKKKAKRKSKSTTKNLPPIGPTHLSAEYISLDDLYHAYRKAKVDVFFERSQPMALEFCQYEKNLALNLNNLREKLTSPSADWYQDPDFIGSYGFIPKGLQLPPLSEKESNSAHFSFSNPDDAWYQLIESSDSSKPTAELRPVALFTVDMYVVCALWVNLIGHKFDACLDRTARGSRLRRLRKKSESQSSIGEYHITAPGSFPPYFYPYKQWRDNGLRAIEHELSERRKVVAITMDLKAFYHNIDPRFIISNEFLKKLHFKKINGESLSNEELIFTDQICQAFVTWAKKLPHLEDSQPPGLPVGPSASRIIANVLLAEFDRLLQQNLDPIYYSRYVDDIFLVLHDNGGFRKSDEVLRHLCDRIEPLTYHDDLSELKLNFNYAQESNLIFQARKQRIFLLSEEVGQDLLDTIKNKIDEISSEWRFLPDLDALEHSPAAKILIANKQPSEDADTLRKADQLSLKRLSFSVMLSHLDTLAHDLPPREWKKERDRFYRFVERHVLTPLRLLDLNDYLPRLIAIAVTCQDWDMAQGLINRIHRAIAELKNNISIEPGTGKEGQFDGYTRHIMQALKEAVIRSYPLGNKSKKADKGANTLLNHIDNLDVDRSDLTSPVNDENRELSKEAEELFWMDLGRIPFKHAVLGYLTCPPCSLAQVTEELPEDQIKRFKTIKEFLAASELSELKVSPEVMARPLLFSTRPFSIPEVTELDPQCVSDLDQLRKFVVAIRGTWVKPVVDAVSAGSDGKEVPEEGEKNDIIVIGNSTWSRQPRIAVTSFLVDDISWDKAAEGNPDLSAARYKRLVRIANAIVKSPNKPDYVVFPELSIPRKWMLGLSKLFIDAGMSLITGVEYLRESTHVINEAYLILRDDRLGYPSWCVIKQRKGLPAHPERDLLRSKFGLTFAPIVNGNKKPIYRHFGHDFGLLICSELTDIRYRQQMRSNVDTLFVLSWNQDIESFGSLVEAAALDVHCYLALINNRKYGDSRVRAPFKKNWKRDQVRVKGGLDDYFVVTELDIDSLRSYQSHHEPPLGEDAKFKPTPEGFRISDSRRRTPGD